jgi:hypothetical protein
MPTFDALPKIDRPPTSEYLAERVLMYRAKWNGHTKEILDRWRRQGFRLPKQAGGRS